MSVRGTQPWLVVGLFAVSFGLLFEWLAGLSLLLFAVVVGAVLVPLLFLILRGSGDVELVRVLFWIAGLFASFPLVRRWDPPWWSEVGVFALVGVAAVFLTHRLPEFLRRRSAGS